MPSRLVVVVTGANVGVGFGICKRFLFELSKTSPSDTQPQFTDVLSREQVQPEPPALPCNELTLVLSCRSTAKAEATRDELLRILDEEIARRKRGADYDTHADVFRANLRIDTVALDLGNISSVIRAGRELKAKYPYISHLICNAGVSDVVKVNHLQSVKFILKNPILAVTAPRYNTCSVGVKSDDGLGFVWQCNVFSHYVLFRELQSSLDACANTSLGPGRVLWTTSIEASPLDYDPTDRQCLKLDTSYATSKFAMDILATRLDMAASHGTGTRHVLIHPGVTHTSIVRGLTMFDALGKLVLFWLARLLGSPHHTIDPYTAAFSAVHLSLVSLALIPAYLSAFLAHPRVFARSHTPLVSGAGTVVLSSRDATLGDGKTTRPVRFGSETDRWGNARVGMTAVRDWEAYAQESEALLEEYQQIYLRFAAKEA